MKQFLIDKASWHYQLLNHWDGPYAYEVRAYGSDSCTYTRKVMLALLQIVAVLTVFFTATCILLYGTMWGIFLYVSWEYSYVTTILMFFMVLWGFAKNTYEVFTYETPVYRKYHFYHDKNGNAYGDYFEASEARSKAELNRKRTSAMLRKLLKSKKQGEYFGARNALRNLKDKVCTKVVVDKSMHY